MVNRPPAQRGFTLIEMSIVLVIIGLIVGGVLVGQDLIRATGARATISQIEKYNTAVTAFQAKYGSLPGDIPDPEATNYGFQSRGQHRGEGDGDGVLEGVYDDLGYVNSADGNQESAGETAVFWQDLAKANLIEGSFSAPSTHVVPGSAITVLSSPAISAFIPAAKIGRGNYIYVYSGGVSGTSNNGRNYFGISTVTEIFNNDPMLSTPGLTVQEAYSIDKKIDDGLPQSGRIVAMYNAAIQPLWAAGGGTQGASGNSATAGSSITCYDNGNTAAAQQQYSLTQSSKGVNCALSFRFQ